MISYEYKGVLFDIDVENNELPQDGQRIVSFLEKKAKDYYYTIADDHARLIKAPFKRWFEFYTKRYNFMPKKVAIYTLCEENVIGEDWSDESKEYSEKAKIDNANIMIDWMVEKVNKWLNEKWERRNEKNN